MADVTLGSAAHAPLRSPGLISRIRSRLSARAEYHRTLNSLRHLDQRMLSDLGITAADIEAIASGKLRR